MTHSIDGRYVSDAEWFALLDQMAKEDETRKPGGFAFWLLPDAAEPALAVTREKPSAPTTAEIDAALAAGLYELSERRDWPFDGSELPMFLKEQAE